MIYINSKHISDYGLYCRPDEEHPLSPTMRNITKTIGSRAGIYDMGGMVEIVEHVIPLATINKTMEESYEKTKLLINDLFDADGRPSTIKLRYEYDDKHYFARVSDEMTPYKIRGFSEFVLTLISYDPFRYGEEEIKELAKVGNNDVATIKNVGMNAQPIFDIEFDSATDHYEIKHIETMRTIKVNYNFVAGDKLRIDATRRRIYINGEIKMPTLTMSSAWFNLQSGDNHFEISPQGDTEGTIRYTPRYL